MLRSSADNMLCNRRSSRGVPLNVSWRREDLHGNVLHGKCNLSGFGMSPVGGVGLQDPVHGEEQCGQDHACSLVSLPGAACITARAECLLLPCCSLTAPALHLCMPFRCMKQ